jgi:hypothetical protein
MKRRKTSNLLHKLDTQTGVILLMPGAPVFSTKVPELVE